METYSEWRYNKPLHIMIKEVEMRFTLKIGYIIGNWEHTWGNPNAHGLELMIGLSIV